MTTGQRAKKAIRSYVPATLAVRRKAVAMEKMLARKIKGQAQTAKAALDVIAGKNGFEVKTIIRGKNNKITVHPESRERKLAAARKMSVRLHTVVFDIRGDKRLIYYRSGVGSFRLENMEKLKNIKEILKRVRL